jgi:signal transduction histidine kinase
VDAPAGLMVCSHREIFGQVLSNLIDNALKYGGDRIILSARKMDGQVQIMVTDNGPGIAEEQRHEALRRFARLDSARHISGAGLGLSLAAAVAHLHGGTLTLGDAAPGLRVSLMLPAMTNEHVTPN